MTYTDRIELITRRIQWLIRHLREKDASILKAHKEIERLKIQIDNQALEIEDLNNKIKIIKLARSFRSDEDTVTLKRKINEYIREIDNSITLLND